MLGIASRAWPKNSSATVRVNFGILCRIQRAEVISAVSAANTEADGIGASEGERLVGLLRKPAAEPAPPETAGE